MNGITNLQTLLKEMKPVLDRTEYVFSTTEFFQLNAEIAALNPIATFLESEGMTVVVTQEKANEHKLKYDGLYNKITLEVHSSLEAVGLTAAFAKALTEHNVSANVIAGYYHDHIFVPKSKADIAMKALSELTK